MKLERALEVTGRFRVLPRMKVSASQAGVRFRIVGFLFQYPEVELDRLLVVFTPFQFLRAMYLTCHFLSETRRGGAKRHNENECDPNVTSHLLLS